MKSFLVSGEEFTLDYSSDAESYESSSSSNWTIFNYLH
jgi:hypothetical protein